MNYLVISSEFPPGPGGIGQHAFSFVNALSQKGEVHVLANQDYAEQNEIETFYANNKGVLRITQFVNRNNKLVHLKRIKQVLKIVNQEKPKTVFVTGRFPLWIGAILKMRFSKLRVEGFVHGTEVTRTGTLSSIITSRAYRILDRVIAVSEFTKALLHPKLNVENIKVIPNGLDNSFLNETAVNSLSPFLWAGAPRLLTVGNLTPRKGQHRVIKALPTILEKHPNSHYHIVGLPTEREEIEKLIRKLNLENNVTIHGRMAERQDLYRAYVSSDIFIMLSENQKNGDLEGFGIAILEANAFSIPAIGSKGCGIEDAISKDSGKIIDGNDSIELLYAIEDLMASEEEYKGGARNWAEKHNWNCLIDKIIK